MQLPKSLSRFIWFFLKLQPFAFIFIVLTACVWAINESLFPYFIKSIINAIHDSQGNAAHIWQIIAIPLLSLSCLWLLMELSMRTQGIVVMKTFPLLRAQIRDTVFNYVRQHSHDYFINHFAGNIANKISDLPSGVETLLQILFFNFIAFFIAFATAIIILWHANPIFSLIMIGWASIHLLLTWAFLKKGHRLAKIHSESSSVVSGKIVDTLTNILNVRLFTAGDYESRYLGQYTREEQSNYKKAIWHLEKMRFFQGGLTGIFIISMICILIYGWSHHWVTLGDFSLVSMLSFTMLGFVWYASYQITNFVREAGKVNSALNLITTTHDIQDAEPPLKLQVTHGAIQFKEVDFHYKNGKPVFNQLSVTIPAGQKVGLVGFSGSGKSSFVNLIMRFYEVQNGSIEIDGQNIAAVTGHSLRQQIAMIPQDPTLFHRTLMENIRYGRVDASDEEVIQASKLAYCHSFVNELDEKYQALVGERGIKLSGGQRQRIAIARAILKNAPILILDEATSSLDSVTEKIIQRSLDELMKKRTTLVIAHRLSTLINMDRILVFDQGKIIEDGSTQELLRLNGHFARLWNLQADGFLPEKLKVDIPILSPLPSGEG